jgi:hypothetical protein
MALRLCGTQPPCNAVSALSTLNAGRLRGECERVIGRAGGEVGRGAERSASFQKRRRKRCGPSHPPALLYRVSPTQHELTPAHRHAVGAAPQLPDPRFSGSGTLCGVAGCQTVHVPVMCMARSRRCCVDYSRSPALQTRSGILGPVGWPENPATASVVGPARGEPC